MASQTITVDTRGLEARLKRLKRTEIPSAMRHALNDLAFDTRTRIVREIQRVFDRPTPAVQKLPQVKAQKNNAAAPPELWLTDYFNRSRTGPSFAVEHHIPGSTGMRSRKGLEIRLERMGLISKNEWLVPSTAMKLNAYGNVPGSTTSKMIADIGGYGQYSGDASNTGRVSARSRRKQTAKKYFWVNVKGRYGVGWRGIAIRNRNSILPQMVVVGKAPRYAPRFRFHAVATSYAARRSAYHASRAVEQQIARRNR